MEKESSICLNTNRKREPLAGSSLATSSSSTASSTSVERQDTEVEMPTTPEQLERMISTRVTAALASNGSGNILNMSSISTPLAIYATPGSAIPST